MAQTIFWNPQLNIWRHNWNRVLPITVGMFPAPPSWILDLTGILQSAPRLPDLKAYSTDVLSGLNDRPLRAVKHFVSNPFRVLSDVCFEAWSHTETASWHWAPHCAPNFFGNVQISLRHAPSARSWKTTPKQMWTLSMFDHTDRSQNKDVLLQIRSIWSRLSTGHSPRSLAFLQIPV